MIIGNLRGEKAFSKVCELCFYVHIYIYIYILLKNQFMYPRRLAIEIWLNYIIVSTPLSRVLSRSLDRPWIYLSPGYKYARSICLLTWKRHASHTLYPDGNQRVTHSLRSFLPFCLLHEYLVREQSRGPLSRFPRDSSLASECGLFFFIAVGSSHLSYVSLPLQWPRRFRQPSLG